MNEDLYLDLSTVLALDTYSRCVSNVEGHAEYAHFNENQLGIPPDILARLGVMQPVAPDKWMGSSRHIFKKHWTPQQPLNLTRHDGEPSIFDLIVTVCLLVEWNGRHVREGPGDLCVPQLSEFPDIELGNDSRFNSEPQLNFRNMAFREAAHQLERLGLGHWNENRRFELISTLLGSSPIALAEAYHETRHLTACRLGGVQFLFPPE